MQQAALVFSLRINHEWYGDTTPALTVTPSNDTVRKINRHGLLFRAVAGGCEVYSTDDEFDGCELELNVVNHDPFLVAHTFTGEPQARGIPKVAHVTLTSADGERRIDPVDWKDADSPNEPLIIVSVILPSTQLPLVSTLRIPAISVHWTYVVNGPWLPDNLEITASDGSEQFTELPSSAIGSSSKTSASQLSGSSSTSTASTRRFRSHQPRVSIRTDQSGYRLVTSDSTTGPLVSPLPSPTPNVLPRPIAGGDSYEIPIYVTVLAKGSS